VARRAPALALLRARCAPACLLTVDGRAAASLRLVKHDLYLPRGEHLVVADYGEGRLVQQRVAIAAGQVRELALQPASEPAARPAPLEATRPTTSEASPRPVATEEARPASDDLRPAATERAPQATLETERRPTREAEPSPAIETERRPLAVVARPDAAPPRRDRRLPPLAPVLGVVLTVGLGGVLAWSITDTLAARDRYVAHPSAAGYQDGVSREARMDGLIGGVAVLGAATLAVAIFATNWRARFAGGGDAKLRAQRVWPNLGVSGTTCSAGLTVNLD
jgi:hypothetical protein